MAVFQVPIIGFHQGNKHSKKMPELGGQEVFSFLLLGPGLFLILNPRSLSLWNSLLYLVLEAK